jgi:tetraacyldisaccharide 4'-kinase
VSVARWIAERLEQGTLLPRTLATALSTPYAAVSARTVARPATLPTQTPVIGIGGAVLGGAGKTPVAIAYALCLADQGLRVALVAHGYRAHTSSPRVVAGDDCVLAVGDDALVAARALQDRACVWVGEDRDLTLRAASECADVVVVDGLLQTRPRRLARSVLVLDGTRPFGAGACPPAGDLRGPVDALVAVCDEVVLVTDTQSSAPRVPRELHRIPGGSIRRARVDLIGVSERNRRMSLESIASLRLGLLTTIARPGRIEASLIARGIRPICTLHGSDHRSLGRSGLRRVRAMARKNRLDAWLVTTKCVTHLAAEEVGCRLLILEVTTRLDPTPQPVLDSPPCVPEDS